MDRDENKTPLITEFLYLFAAMFTMMVLAISIAGMLLARYDSEVRSTLFAPGRVGLSYSTLMQITAFAFIMAIFATLLFSEHFLIKMRFLFRIFLLFLATLITFSIFAIIFGWFPIDQPLAWFGFILCTLFCFSVSIIMTLIKYRLEGKKYDRLLMNYKARHNSHQSLKEND